MEDLVSELIIFKKRGVTSSQKPTSPPSTPAPTSKFFAPPAGSANAEQKPSPVIQQKQAVQPQTQAPAPPAVQKYTTIQQEIPKAAPPPTPAASKPSAPSFWQKPFSAQTQVQEPPVPWKTTPVQKPVPTVISKPSVSQPPKPDVQNRALQVGRPTPQPQQPRPQQARPQPTIPAQPMAKPAHQPEPQPVRHATRKAAKAQEQIIPRTDMSIKESIHMASGLYCINHPWRNAYAICNVCLLPYCYVDIMEKDDRMYCIPDIDKIEHKEEKKPALNTLSVLSSVIFVVNSIVLGLFVYPQAIFLSGHLHQLLTSTYLMPIANIAIVVLGLVAAALVVRRSIVSLIFSLGISMFGLITVFYEYLISSSPYFFVSTTLLLICLAAVIYSRMSSVSEVLEGNALKEIDWPKPETF